MTERKINMIQTELKDANLLMFQLIPETDLIFLSHDNVAKVEAMIRNDSAYLKSSDRSAGPCGHYSGSTAYWMTQLKIILWNLLQCQMKSIGM